MQVSAALGIKRRWLMIRSMTGYGKGESVKNGKKLTAEIKAVNHRYLDLAIRAQKILNPFDQLARQMVGKRVSRGKLDIYISYESLSKEGAKLSLDIDLADACHEALKKTADRYGLAPVLLSDMLRFDIISVEKAEEDESSQAEAGEALEEALGIALDGLCAMREAEGETLRRDMAEKIQSLRAHVARVKERSPQAEKEHVDRLKARLADFLAGPDFDERRVITEIALMADRACIDEEITRAESHLAQLEGFLDSSEPMGRKMDFLVQELNREVNTIGSKCGDLAVARDVVDMKSEIEKIREQVQNIE
jgi:uncharacterized protein (TIGR00255 family)